MAPLLKLYGSGHSRIIINSLIPSCFSTRLSAANRLLRSASRLTYLRSTVLLTMKLAVDPTIVAEATINHPYIPHTNPATVTHVE